MSLSKQRTPPIKTDPGALCLRGDPAVIKNGRRPKIARGQQTATHIRDIEWQPSQPAACGRHALADCDNSRAAGSLRSALWRLRGADIDSPCMKRRSSRQSALPNARQRNFWATYVHAQPQSFAGN